MGRFTLYAIKVAILHNGGDRQGEIPENFATISPPGGDYAIFNPEQTSLEWCRLAF